MPICNMKALLLDAQKNHYGVGAFQFWSLDSAAAILSAAEKRGMPVILQAGPLECDYAGTENLVELAKMAAKTVRIPVALHLDHGDTPELARAALKAGFTSVMIDASALDFEKNVAVTRQVVELARETGAGVEAELGRLMGNEGNLSTQEREAYETDPELAAEFVRQTGVDALAVAIGSAHGFYTREPRLNIPRLQAIRERVSVPLVLHGGTGIPEEQIREAVRHGMTKVNICTEFLAAVGKGYTETQNAEGFRYSVPGLFAPPMERGRALVAKKIDLFANGVCLYPAEQQSGGAAERCKEGEKQ